MNSGLPLLVLAVVLGAAGCHTRDHQVNTVENANPTAVRRPIADKRIVRDKATAKAVQVLQVLEGSSDTGLARIGVEVQNQTGFAFRFNYRFDWFDPQGFPVSTPTATAISQQIEAGQVMTLVSVSPTPAAKDFRLSIQESTRDYNPILRKN